jgi:hypothetical protein
VKRPKTADSLNGNAKLCGCPTTGIISFSLSTPDLFSSGVSHQSCASLLQTDTSPAGKSMLVVIIQASEKFGGIFKHYTNNFFGLLEGCWLPARVWRDYASATGIRKTRTLVRSLRKVILRCSCGSLCEDCG